MESAKSDIEQDWRDYNDSIGIEDYFEKGKYVVSPGTSFSMSSKDDVLKTTWSQTTTCIKTESWKAMYAKTDKEFDKIVANMIKQADHYGYQECLEWSRNEAARRRSLEEAITQ